jgi:hypothetical protein
MIARAGASANFPQRHARADQPKHFNSSTVHMQAFVGLCTLSNVRGEAG